MVKSLSVVIPAYNEAANIAACIEKVSQVLSRLKLDSEIIVVNDGSKDETGAIAEKYAKRLRRLRVVHNRPNRGYGGSLRAGFAAATKDFIAFFPADNQFDFNDISHLLTRQSETDSDIVSGIRPGGGADPLHRKFNRWGWNTVVRALFGYLATDIDCGFKLFRRRILDQVNLTAEKGAMIDTQLFAGARARGFTVSEIPLTHLPRTAGHSTGANLGVIIQSFIDLFSFWWQLKQEILTEKGLAVFRWELLALVAILAAAAFSRLYRIDAYMTFLGDEGRDALVMLDLITGRNFPLIGPGTSIGNMYLGPWYYYLVTPALFLANFSPVGPAVLVALIGVATVALMWWVGRQWFGRASALAVSLLFALSPTVIIYSRSSWNPNVMPFFALLAVYAIWKVWRHGYWRWLVVAAVSLVFVLNSHYLGLLLLPVVGLFWLLAVRTSAWLKPTLFSAAVFAVMMSPLLAFDLRHNWQNFGAISKFFTERQTTVNLQPQKSLPNLWPIYEEVTASLLTAKNPALARAVGLLVLVVVVFILVRRPASRDLILVSVWLAVGVIGLGLYKQHIYDHYFGFLFPAVFLLLGFVLRRLGRLAAVLVAILLFVNLAAHPLRYPPNYQLQHTRLVAEFVNREAEGRPFNLALLASSNYDASYRYFLRLADAPLVTVHQQVAEQLFVVCELSECNPIGNPLFEIASFGWAKIEREWQFPWGVKLFKLVRNSTGQAASL